MFSIFCSFRTQRLCGFFLFYKVVMVVALATFDLIFLPLSDVRPGLVICCSYGFLSVFFNAIQINDGYSFILLPIDGHQLVLFCLIFKSSSLWVTFVMNLS